MGNRRDAALEKQFCLLDVGEASISIDRELVLALRSGVQPRMISKLQEPCLYERSRTIGRK